MTSVFELMLGAARSSRIRALRSKFGPYNTWRAYKSRGKMRQETRLLRACKGMFEWVQTTDDIQDLTNIISAHEVMVSRAFALALGDFMLLLCWGILAPGQTNFHRRLLLHHFIVDLGKMLLAWPVPVSTAAGYSFPSFPCLRSWFF